MNWKCWQKIGSMIGQGGSGQVYKVSSNINNEEMVLKQLNKESIKFDRIKRFITEIEILKKIKNKKIKGVIDIEDSYMDYKNNLDRNVFFNSNLDKKEVKEAINKGLISNEDYWYVMPKGISFSTRIKENGYNTFEIVEDFIKLIDTLQQLHKIEIAHRDIKPSNIIWINDRLYFIDFGIAKDLNASQESNHCITEEYDKRQLGAKFTRPPEMSRIPAEADPYKADIYSLMKTLWIFIVGDEYCFEGQYNEKNRKHSLNFIKNINGEPILDRTKHAYFHKFLHEMLNKATDDEPLRRPSLETIKINLKFFLNLKVNENPLRILCSDAITRVVSRLHPNIFDYELIRNNEYVFDEEKKYEEDYPDEIIIHKCTWNNKNQHVPNYAAYLLIQNIHRSNLRIINKKTNVFMGNIISISTNERNEAYEIIFWNNGYITDKLKIKSIEYIYEKNTHLINIETNNKTTYLIVQSL